MTKYLLFLLCLSELVLLCLSLLPHLLQPHQQLLCLWDLPRLQSFLHLWFGSHLGIKDSGGRMCEWHQERKLLVALLMVPPCSLNKPPHKRVKEWSWPLYWWCSLVPRPSPAPVFDCLQYAWRVLQAIKNWSQGRPENESTDDGPWIEMFALMIVK